MRDAAPPETPGAKLEEFGSKRSAAQVRQKSESWIAKAGLDGITDCQIQTVKFHRCGARWYARASRMTEGLRHRGRAVRFKSIR
jgi:hypothetical protein